jgi:Flp pilus assembly secretin CpaC
MRSLDKNLGRSSWTSLCLSVVLGFTVPALAQVQITQAADGTQLGSPGDGQGQPGFAEQLRPTQRKAGKATLYNRPYQPVKSGPDDADIPEIVMFVGESRVFPAPGVGRIAVGNGSILTAAALDGKEVILFANGAGTSSLFIWSQDGRHQRVKISIVPGDTSRIAREISTFLASIPAARTSVIGDKVIVEGEGLSNTDLERIAMLSERYPQIVNFSNRQGFERMVMIDVKVVEFPVNEFRALGLRWNAVGGTAIGAIWSPVRRHSGRGYQIGVQDQESTLPPITLGGDGSASPGGLNVLSLVNLGLNATLDALAQQGKTVMLAEPQLSARNGATASFLAGGEYPYVVSNSDGPTVMFKPYGVRLDIAPRVDREGNIRAEIETEVSTIDHSVATMAGPGLLSNKTRTEFDLRSGETVVLSGMLQRFSSDSVDKVPLLGDIPIIGALFRSKRYQNRETELVFFVTPTVVDPGSAAMADRIERTRERLGQRLGPAPHLSDPLQPATDPAYLGDVPARGTNAAPVESGSGLTEGAPVTDGSSPAMPDEPEGAPDARFVAAAAPAGPLLRVVRDGVVLRELPDAKARLLAELSAGTLIPLRDTLGLASGLEAWRPVRVGDLAGWIASRDVVAVESES